MKILVPGREDNGPAPESGWWIDRPFPCANCPCVFAPEAGDTVNVYQDVADPEIQILWVRCPCCGLAHRFRSDDPVLDPNDLAADAGDLFPEPGSETA